MRRFLAFAALFAFSLPVGLSIAGCGHDPGNYCIKNGHAYGITTKQATYAILQPETVGVSLSWGQTYQVGPAQAYNCIGGSVGVGSWIYASSNLQLADISPAGTLCAGTWNRNSAGGVPNFTICTPPAGASVSAFNGCTSSTCGIATVTATGAAVTSNPVSVYIHPPVTSVTIASQSACVPQGQPLKDTSGNAASFLEETTVLGPGGAVLCSPTTISCTNPAANVGTITYSAVTPSIVTINNTTNPVNPNPVTGPGTAGSNANGTATANLPGSTVINANLSDSDVTSAAGFFSTCPPAKITLSMNGGTTGTVTPNSPQTAVATATDSQGNTISGLTLNFSSTEPQNLSASSTGLITSTFPSHATVSAVCTPPGCNPAPVNLIGINGNGMPVAANNITVNSPGRVSNQLWMASSQSQSFSEVDLTTGGTAAPVVMPYPPNSMQVDQGGSTLYFGSYHELMIYTAINNRLSKEVPGVPGVVLAVSPANNSVVVDDQLRQVIYLYATATGSASSIAGIANKAMYSPDGSTVYITGMTPAGTGGSLAGQNTLFVYNNATGWSSYPLTNQTTPYNCALDASETAAVPAYNASYDPFCGQSLALTVPDVAAFTSGDASTAANSYCPNASATPPYYPPAGGANVPTQQITATADGDHILGADTTTFSDILLLQNGTSGPPGVPVGACPAYNGPALTVPTSFSSGTLPVSASEIDQVVSSPYSNLAFVTYQGSGATGLLPYYVPTPATSSSTTSVFGTLGTVQLSAGAQAPVAGAFSPDGSLFFVSTSGDNLVHLVDTGTLKDCASTAPGTDVVCSTQTIDPKLTGAPGTATPGAPVPAQFLAVKSRSTT